MSRQAGSMFGELKAAPDIRQNGPAAGGGYVLRVRPKVKVGGTVGPDKPPGRAGIGSGKINGLAESV
jgi:hypothetical protein